MNVDTINKTNTTQVDNDDEFGDYYYGFSLKAHAQKSTSSRNSQEEKYLSSLTVYLGAPEASRNAPSNI